MITEREQCRPADLHGYSLVVGAVTVGSSDHVPVVDQSPSALPLDLQHRTTPRWRICSLLTREATFSKFSSLLFMLLRSYDEGIYKEIR